MSLVKKIVEFFTGKTEDNYHDIYNPLKAHVGDTLTLNTINYNDLVFFVKEIKEGTREILDNEFKFTDYMLFCKQIGKPALNIILRVMPQDDEFIAIALEKYDEFVYNESFKEILNENEFVTKENEQETGRYWRPNDIKTSYEVVYKIIDSNNEKANFPLKKQTILYWDFWRNFKEGLAEITEYLFVEMEKNTGYFTILRGEEVLLSKIDVR